MLTRDIRMRTPDITIVVEEEIAEGDAVVHVSEYVVFDRLGMLRQLGLAPAPEQPPA